MFQESQNPLFYSTLPFIVTYLCYFLFKSADEEFQNGHYNRSIQYHKSETKPCVACCCCCCFCLFVCFFINYWDRHCSVTICVLDCFCDDEFKKWFQYIISAKLSLAENKAENRLVSSKRVKRREA